MCNEIVYAEDVGNGWYKPYRGCIALALNGVQILEIREGQGPWCEEGCKDDTLFIHGVFVGTYRQTIKALREVSEISGGITNV